MATRKKPVNPDAPVEPIRVEAKGTNAVLHLEGVVGVMQAKRLQQLAIKLAGSDRAVKVRCEHLQHLDCASVQVLLALHETLKGKGAGITIQNMPDSVHQTLRIAGLASAFQA
jgi:anti-anti-sigma factor